MNRTAIRSTKLIVGIVIALATIVLFICAAALAATGQWSPSVSSEWPHENDTPPFRLENSNQWMCVTDGTLQLNGTDSSGYWCTDASTDLESE